MTHLHAGFQARDVPLTGLPPGWRSSDGARLAAMTTRRAFARRAGLFASAALVAPDVLAQPRHKMGLQLFTIRDALRRDVAGTLKSIAALGYQEVETYGFDPDAIGYYRLPAKIGRAHV